MGPDSRLYANPGARSAEPHDRLHALFTIALCAIWIFTGLFPHDPWKPDEAHGFGLDRYIAEPLRIEEGFAIAPSTPGHGITFDWKALDSIRA